MKKSIISLLLAVCMVFSLSINVLAYEMNSWCWYKSHNENDGRIMEELSGEAAHPMPVHICPVVNGEPDRTNIILPKIQNVKVFNELDEDVTSCFQFENHSKNNGLPTLIIVPDQEMQGDYTIIYVDEELNINLSLPLTVEPYVETVTEGYAWIDEDGNEVTVINAFVGEPVSVRFKNLSSGEIVHLDGKSANGVEGAVIREYDSETKTITYTFTTTELHDGKNIFTVIATHTEGIWIEFPLTIVVSEKDAALGWLYWDFTDSVRITGYDGELTGEIVVPSEINGKKVTMFQAHSQYNNASQVIKITIPEGVTYIEGDFGQFTALTEINLPESLTQLNLDITCPNLKTINYAGTEAQWNSIRKHESMSLDGITLNFGKEMTNEWTYKPNGGSANLTGFDGILEGEVTIPSEIDGRKVCCLDSRALAGQSRITKVIIPDGLSWISYGAFTNCTNLEEITIPESITSISSCFAGCANLKVINFAGTKTQWNTINRDNNSIPENVIVNFGKETNSLWSYTENEDGTVTLYGYDGELSGEVVIPSTVEGKAVTILGHDLFAGNSEITSVIIPDTVTEFVGIPFHNCTNLKSITIPSSVIHQGSGDSPFSGCDALEEFILVGENHPFTFENGMLILKDELLFCIRSTSAICVIPEGVDFLHFDVFENCTKITEINIPESVTRISDGFDSCDNLKTINYAGTEAQWNSIRNIESLVLEGITLNFGKEMTNQWLYEERNSSSINITGFDGILEGEVTIPSEIDGKKVYRVNSNALAGQTKITKVVVSNGIERLNNGAFYNCTSLEEVDIPESVSYLWYCFTNCTNLKTINYAGSEARWNVIEKSDNLLPEGVNLNFNFISAKETLDLFGTHANLTVPTDLVYNGDFQSLVVWDYYYGTEPIHFKVNGILANPVDNPLGKEAGTYTVTYWVPESEQFYAVPETTITVTIAAQQSVNYGDTNGDNSINSADVNLLYRAVMDYMELTEAQASAADVNHDGSVNSADVNLLYRYVMGYAELQA